MVMLKPAGKAQKIAARILANKGVETPKKKTIENGPKNQYSTLR